MIFFVLFYQMFLKRRYNGLMNEQKFMSLFCLSFGFYCSVPIVTY